MNRGRLFKAALFYFALVFAVGFALGTVRVLWMVPQLGIRTAELAELPFMLIASYLAARWVVRKFTVPQTTGARLAVGFTALACLLLFEFTLVPAIQGITASDAVASRDPVSGTAYALSLLIFGLLPLLAGRR